MIARLGQCPGGTERIVVGTADERAIEFKGSFAAGEVLGPRG